MFKSYKTALRYAQNLRLFPKTEARRELLKIAQNQDLLKAVRVSALTGSPYLIESLRNDLVQEHDELIKLGKIEKP